MAQVEHSHYSRVAVPREMEEVRQDLLKNLAGFPPNGSG